MSITNPRPSPTERGHSERATLYALLIVLLALVLRLYHLGSESLWLDEGFSLRDALHLDILNETRPLYFLLLSGWMKLGATSEFWLRFPSAICGAASVWVLYVTGRRLMGSSVALMASLFMACSVLNVNHSREIRMYSLTSLIVLLSTYLLLLSLEQRKARYIGAYLAMSIAGLLTQPLTVLVLAAHGLFLLLYAKVYRPGSAVLIGGQIGVVALWYPWLMRNMGVAAEYSQGITSQIDKPTILGTVNLLGRFFLWKWHSPGKTMLLAALAFSAIVVLIAFLSLKGFRMSDARRTFVWLWLVVPLVGMAIASYTIGNIWMVHYLIAVSPAFYLLVAQGIQSMRIKPLSAIALLVVMLPTLGRLWMYMSKPARPEWARAVSYVERNERPGDVIGIYYGGNQYIFRYYYRGGSRWAPLGTDEITYEHWGGWNDARVRDLLATLPFSGRRLWLLMSNHDMAGGTVISNYLFRRYRTLDHRYYSQVELLLVDANGAPVPGIASASRGYRRADSVDKVD